MITIFPFSQYAKVSFCSLTVRNIFYLLQYVTFQSPTVNDLMNAEPGAFIKFSTFQEGIYRIGVLSTKYSKSEEQVFTFAF